MQPDEQAQRWTFLSNHAHVICCLFRDPDATMREVAQQVGITERAVQRIVAELAADGVVEISRQGRRNHYRINPDHHLHHPLEAHRTVRDLLRILRAPRELSLGAG